MPIVIFSITSILYAESPVLASENLLLITFTPNQIMAHRTEDKYDNIDY
jgi:hypothetical protein